MTVGPEILVVEDDVNFVKLIEITLSLGGYQIGKRISWLAEFKALVDEGQLPPIITIDNDIFGGAVDKSNLIPKIRSKYPRIKLIGLSCCDVEGVDVDLKKENLCKLPFTIRKLIS